MANPTGSYQPFGTGWNNLTSYLTKSNLDAAGKGEKSGAANMQRYQSPDAGAAFDDWLTGVNKSAAASKATVNTDRANAPAPAIRSARPSVPQDDQPEAEPTPGQQWRERKKGWQDERTENPYDNSNSRYKY